MDKTTGVLKGTNSYLFNVKQGPKEIGADFILGSGKTPKHGRHLQLATACLSSWYSTLGGDTMDPPLNFRYQRAAENRAEKYSLIPFSNGSLLQHIILLPGLTTANHCVC
uniref:Uncharacterized protein n=1 Tax=Anguilla anguilla TaxID=7936 RepID=A0A0E9WR25_ANGAN